MQTALNNFTKLGMKQVESALGNQKFWYGNRQYPCTPSAESRGQTVEIGGYDIDVVLSLHVRREILPSGVTVDSMVITVDSDIINADTDDNPKRFGVGKVLDRPNTNEVTSQNGFRNRRYRVIRVNLDPSGIYYKLDLADPN